MQWGDLGLIPSNNKIFKNSDFESLFKFKPEYTVPPPSEDPF